MGADVSWPNAIKIIRANGGTVEFEVMQLWQQSDVPMMAVHYHDDVSSSNCDMAHPVQYKATRTYVAHCFEGFTDVSVYLYIGDNFDVATCEACQAPGDTSTDMVAYYFEIPCVTTCEPVDDCYEQMQIKMVEKVGADLSLPEKAVKIIGANGDSVDFVVTQLWEENEIPMMAVHYHDAVGSTNCDMNHPVAYGLTETYTAHCFEGFTEVSIYLHVGAGFDVTTCEACKAPGENATNMVAYYFELPCDSTCEPTGAFSAPPAELKDCYSGPVLQDVKGTCLFDKPPIEIISMNDASVSFSISNTWSQAGSVLDEICVQFQPNPMEEYDFRLKKNQAPGLVSSYDATCNSAGIAEISIYVHDASFDATNQVQIPAQCESSSSNPPSRSCAYNFIIPCKKDLLCDANTTTPVRRLDELDTDEAFKSTEFEAVNEPSINEDDIPYCVSEDFPCEGDGSNMVFVCHYSARKGYQTFCIPESDSDILRFYPNDYCGPCEGGYGGLWN